MEDLLSKAEPIPFSGCFILTQKADKDGYVKLGRDGRDVYAHRLSYQIYKGPIPHGLCVCHTCDIPSCVNPGHLFLGTHQDNMRDMRAKGRGNYGGFKVGIGSGLIGESHGRARLREVDIVPIRNLNLPDIEIAKQYGVSRSSINDVRNRRTWRHV